MHLEHLPDEFEECIELYLAIWQLFSNQTFSPDTLIQRLIDHDYAIEYITGDNEPQKQLNLLAAAGLVSQLDEDQYRIRCPPNQGLEYWKDQQSSHIESIYQYIQRHQEERNTASENRLQRHGATFESVFLTEQTDLSQLTAAVDDALEDASTVTGVVLRSPAELAHHVQQLADQLCDREHIASDNRGPLEKTTADVVGEHKDDLEYRLYLQEKN